MHPCPVALPAAPVLLSVFDVCFCSEVRYALPTSVVELVVVMSASYHCPGVRTFCIMLLAVFISSALVWNARLAEIMSAISSTTLTFG